MQDHIPGELVCVCGRIFATPQPYSKHIGACKLAKKRGRRADRLAKSYRKQDFNASELPEVDVEMANVKFSIVDVANGLAGSSSADSALVDQAMDGGDEVELTTQAIDEIISPCKDIPEPLFENLVDAGIAIDLNASAMQPEAPLLERRSQRKKFLPWKRREMLPEGPGPLLIETANALSHIDLPQPEARYDRISIQIAPNIRLHLTKQIQTAPNSFGLYRTYYALPSQIPDEDFEVQKFIADTDERIIISADDEQDLHSLWPYPNISCFRLGKWWLDGATKSTSSFRKLIQVLRMPDFRLKDVTNAPWDYINRQLATRTTKGFSDDWVKHSVSIRIPTGIKQTKKQMKKQQTEDISIENQFFTVEGVLVRPLVSVIKDTFSHNSAIKSFHFEPFKQFWEPPDSPGSSIRVYDEIYTSDAFLKAHEDLQNSPKEPGCDLPRAVIALMFWSDSTSLAQFGSASLWPIYLYWGNQSKYERCRPSADACQHVAYLPKLPANVTDFIANLRRGKAATQTLLTHCRRELYHATLRLLFDDSFIEAYKHGIVIQLSDNTTWRMYPRLLTWAADYPEKVYLASIKEGTEYMCTRCDGMLAQAHKLGTFGDRRIRTTHARIDCDSRRTKISIARELVYEKGYSIDSKCVRFFLKHGSWAPIENAFSSQLGFTDFNYFQMLTCDLMHEVELGVWKALLIHLIRMLWSIGPNIISVFNQRFREVPPFGQSTIRRFADNVSDLKKLAAHNYEDILQCFIPVFEGLLPEPYNGHIASLLSRSFVDDVCPYFMTLETPSEIGARNRQNESNMRQKSTKLDGGSHKAKKFNINTFKFHMLGHYVDFIRLYGTTDSYSTMIGETAHRVAKVRYRLRTNKRDFLSQLAKLDSTERNLKGIEEELRTSGVPNTSPREESVHISPTEEFSISNSNRRFFNVGVFCAKYEDDPAVKNFLEQLKDHLLTRLLQEYHPGDEHEFTPKERNRIFFQHGRIYEHSIMRLNYTSYDIRREQDFINLSTKKQDIMVEANEDEKTHPYWYARVHGIFHAQVQLQKGDGHLEPPVKMFFLWVRWLGRDLDHQCGWDAKRLDRIGFVPHEDPQAFGFLNPNTVVRSCHLIPAFNYGRTQELCPPSIVRDSQGDWKYFYVNRFVDRDMFMRYLGGAIGHSIRTEDTFTVEMDEQAQIEEITGPRSSDPVNLEHGPDIDMDLEAFSDSSIGTGDYDSDCSHEIFCDEETENVHVTNDFIYL